MLKKEREMREKILNRIEELLHAGSKLNEAEKKILMEYHERIEKSKNMEFELVHLRNALLPFIIFLVRVGILFLWLSSFSFI